jgi:hypothetical protein
MNKEIMVSFPTDENGLTGRECPKCGKYFKVKFGTGLPTSTCICPYCGRKSDQQDFFTKEQIEYAKSVVLKEVLGPGLAKLEKDFKDLERATRRDFIQIKVKTKSIPLRLKHYQERELETHVICDSCGLEFAVYGVFASCPDCGRLNASVVFSKSIEVSKKQLNLIESIADLEFELKEAILKGTISGGISAFDAFGKALRKSYPSILPNKQKNLFQNLEALSEALQKHLSLSLEGIIGRKEAEILNRLFQVRHIYEHNMGVIDDDFVKKVPSSHHLKGRKYSLDESEIQNFLDILSETGKRIEENLEVYFNGP